jgi:hypothetical protein
LQRNQTDWALIWSERVDDRPDMGFDQTDPLVRKYLDDHFDLVRWTDFDGPVRIVRRRGAQP